MEGPPSIVEAKGPDPEHKTRSRYRGRLVDEDADPLDNNTLVDSEIDRCVALEVAAALEDNTSRSIVDVSATADPGASLTGESADLAPAIRYPMLSTMHAIPPQSNRTLH